MEKLVSVEKVLNSRCSCDFDGDPRKNHWGSFVKDRCPSRKTLEHILKCCTKTPQFSKDRLQSWFKENFLFLGLAKVSDPFKNRLLHIESGMQQEAVYLACTALGVGTCIRNLGIDGTEYQHKTATARHIILEKTASYGDRKFTTVIPGPKKPFRKGRALSVPRREGKEECLPALEQLSLSQDGAHAEENDISQMLWAAKGRTPHYVKSHPWGLTIPTWAGHQNHTSVHLVKEKKLYRYVNWTLSRYINWKANSFPWWIAGNPTHDIKFVKKLKTSTSSYLPNTGIVLTRNEKTNRALWEVGYMLENMFLQAKSLQIEYKSKVLEEAEIREIEKEQISEPVAILIL